MHFRKKSEHKVVECDGQLVPVETAKHDRQLMAVPGSSGGEICVEGGGIMKEFLHQVLQ